MNNENARFLRLSGLMMGFGYLLVPIVGLFWSLFTFRRNEAALLAAWENPPKDKMPRLRSLTMALVATWHAAFAQIALLVTIGIFLAFFFLLGKAVFQFSYSLFWFVFIVVGTVIQVWAAINGFILAANVYSQEAK